MGIDPAATTAADGTPAEARTRARPGRPSRIREIGEESRRRLLDAAEQLFAEKGFDKTSFADVGERSGISRGSIPWHFGNKDGLLFAVVERSAQQWARDYAPKPGSAGLDQAVTTAKDLLRTPTASLLFMVASEAMEPESPIHDRYRDWHREIRARLGGWLASAQREAGQVSADNDAMTAVVLGALIGLNLQWHLDPDAVDLDRALEVLAAMIGAALWPTGDPGRAAPARARRKARTPAGRPRTG